MIATTSGSSAIHARAECCGGNTTIAVAGGAPSVFNPPRSRNRLKSTAWTETPDVPQQEGQFAEVQVMRIQDQCGHPLYHRSESRNCARAGGIAREGESLAPMSDEHPVSPVARHVRALAELFVETDLLRLRIERNGEEIELGRRALHP